MKKPIVYQNLKEKDREQCGTYSEYISKRGKIDKYGNIAEDVRANPDQLGEADSYLKIYSSKRKKAKLKLVLSAYFKNCSPEDKILLSLLSNKNGTVRDIATRLGVSPTTVQYRINKIRSKLNRRIKNVSSNPEYYSPYPW